MKKLLIVLFSVLALAGCANNPYKIDPVATANAPWKVGERIIEEEDCFYNNKCYRDFLGINESGQILIQEFYFSGVKASDPFFIQSLDGAMTPFMDSSFTFQVVGEVIVWYESGQLLALSNYHNGELEGGLTWWYENGQKSMEGYFFNGREIGVWRTWDEDGNLMSEIDYGLPQN